jgi:hypothetical protein
MKRIFILVTVVLFAVGSLYAEERNLIDFTKLAADITTDGGDAPNENRVTMMDYTRGSRASYTGAVEGLMRTSLAIQNWEVVLAPSSRNVTNARLSYVLPTQSTTRGTVMGIRVHFPLEPVNSWARVVPPFEIPAYEPNADVADDGTISEAADGGDGINTPSRFEGPVGDDGKPSGGYGVVKNVGTIREIEVNYYGLNFPHSLSVVLLDDLGNEHIYPMGSLRTDGWHNLVWRNPSYVSEVRNRSIRLYPLYPQTTPFVKFGGFVVHREGSDVGGDFITYIQNVNVVYDLATLDTPPDINSEGRWNIIRDRETEKKERELQDFGAKQVDRHLEQERRATEPSFSDPVRNQDAAQQ